MERRGEKTIESFDMISQISYFARLTEQQNVIRVNIVETNTA